MSNNFSLTLGGVVGVPEDRSSPDSALYLGITYSPGNLKKNQEANIIFTENSNIDEHRDLQHEAVLGEIDLIEKRLESIEGMLTQQAKSAKEISISLQNKNADNVEEDDRLTVEIIVPEGMSNFNEYIDSFIRSGNYRITQTSIKSLVKERSFIYYRYGMSDEAVSLGHGLKGDQIVLNKNLPNGIDMQILLGKDLLD